MYEITSIEKLVSYQPCVQWMIVLNNGEFVKLKRPLGDTIFQLVSDISQLPTVSRLSLMQLNQIV